MAGCMCCHYGRWLPAGKVGQTGRAQHPLEDAVVLKGWPIPRAGHPRLHGLWLHPALLVAQQLHVGRRRAAGWIRRGTFPPSSCTQLSRRGSAGALAGPLPHMPAPLMCRPWVWPCRASGGDVCVWVTQNPQNPNLPNTEPRIEKISGGDEAACMSLRLPPTRPAHGSMHARRGGGRQGLWLGRWEGPHLDHVRSTLLCLHGQQRAYEHRNLHGRLVAADELLPLLGPGLHGWRAGVMCIKPLLSHTTGL